MVGRLWARITGLKGWDREVTILKNTEDDDTPAPGDTPGIVTERTGQQVERMIAPSQHDETSERGGQRPKQVP